MYCNLYFKEYSLKFQLSPTCFIQCIQKVCQLTWPVFPKLKCCIFVVKIGKYYSGLGWQICELFCGKRGRGFATITSRAKTHLQRKPAGGGLWSGKSYPVERCVTLRVRGVFSSSLGGCMTPRVRGVFSPPWGSV